MHDVNTIVICKEDYETEDDFENAVKRAVMVLLENNYIMTVRWDEKGLGILCIEHERNDTSLGNLHPYWLSPEEIECVIFDNQEE